MKHGTVLLDVFVRQVLKASGAERRRLLKEFRRVLPQGGPGHVYRGSSEAWLTATVVLGKVVYHPVRPIPIG